MGSELCRPATSCLPHAFTGTAFRTTTRLCLGIQTTRRASEGGPSRCCRAFKDPRNVSDYAAPNGDQRVAGKIRRRIEVILDAARLECEALNEVWEER